MPTRSLALEPGGPRRLAIQWSGFWKNVTVRLDGQELGVLPDKDALEMGQSFTLPDGSQLRVCLENEDGLDELQVTRDGRPLPGSASDPAERVKQAAHVLYFLAGVSLVCGLLATMASIGFFRELGAGWSTVVSGTVYGLLGYLTTRHWRSALLVGMALFALDGVVMLVERLWIHHELPLAVLSTRAGLFLLMARSLPAFREIPSPDRAL